MSRIACLLVLLTGTSATAADLPPGALVRLGDDRYRAGGPVTHLALSPDGKQFATARLADIGFLALTVWDAATGRPVHERRVNTDLFRGLVWGKGGAFAVVGRSEPGEKGKLRVLADDFHVWDFTDPDAAPPLAPAFVGRDIHDRPPRYDAAYTRFHFSADGMRVAAEWETAGGKFAIHVFELKPASTAAKLTRVGTIDLGAEGADAVRISAGGQALVTFRKCGDPELRGDAEFVATVWDVARGKPGRPVRVPGGHFMLMPDARSLAVGVAGTKEWGFDLLPLALPDKSPPRQRKRIRWPHTHSDEERRNDQGGHAFNASGTVLLVAADRKTLVIDATDGRELGRLEGHAETPGAVAVSADGAWIATADVFGMVRLWDAKTLRAAHDAPGHRAPVEHAELSPDGKRLLTWAHDETVILWDVATGKELRAFAGAPGLRRAGAGCFAQPTFTPDGTAILYATKHRLIARDLLTGLEVPLPGDLAKLPPRHAAFAPDGKAVLTWSRDAAVLTVWEWPSGKKRFTLDERYSMASPGFSPDGTAVFPDCESPRRWDAKSGQELPPAWDENRRFMLASLSSLRPNPRLLLDTSGGTPRILAAGTGEPVPPFRLVNAKGTTQRFESSDNAISPCGRQFAGQLQRDQGEVQIREAATGQVRRTLTGHRGSVRVLGFTPDGTKLLTAGGDHTVLVWDMRLQNVPLPEAIKKETDAVKLWNALASGTAQDAYLAMARLARDPEAAIKIAKLKLTPVAKNDRDSDATKIADSRAIELLEAIDTEETRKLLTELAGGHADAFRTQEAKRTIERGKK